MTLKGLLARMRFASRRNYALSRGYFWLPCNLCGEYMGGNEWKSVDGKSSGVRCRAHFGRGHGICQKCTAAGRGEQISNTDRPLTPCPYCGERP